MTGFLDPTHLIDTFGLIGIAVVLFAGFAPRHLMNVFSE